MDHHLKGIHNQFDDRQPVRLEVRSSRDDVHQVRMEQSWPLSNVEHRPLSLSTDGLKTEPVVEATDVSYAIPDGTATFDITFDEDTELSGYMKLGLWVEARPTQPGGQPPDDMIVCVFVDKLDRAGNSVRFNGSVGQTEDVVTRGCLRVSRRELDMDRSTSWKPVPKGDTETC